MGEERTKEMETRKPIPPREAECPCMVGQGVARSAFNDAAGVYHARVDGLTVERTVLYPAYSIPSYHRVTARGQAGEFEGASYYFEPAP